MTPAQPGQEQRMERGDLRMIFTDGAGLASPSMQRELGEDVWAIIGPNGKHTSHPELQDALGLVCMAFNRRHGRLSAEKHAEIAKGHEAGSALLLEATRPTADLGDDGELVERLLARCTNDGLGDPDDDLINPDGPEAATRLILYRGRELGREIRIEQVVSAWAFAHDINGAVRNDLLERLRQEGLSRSGG